jgi:hypothetical protein
MAAGGSRGVRVVVRGLVIRKYESGSSLSIDVTPRLAVPCHHVRRHKKLEPGLRESGHRSRIRVDKGYGAACVPAGINE